MLHSFRNTIMKYYNLSISVIIYYVIREGYSIHCFNIQLFIQYQNCSNYLFETLNEAYGLHSCQLITNLLLSDTAGRSEWSGRIS